MLQIFLTLIVYLIYNLFNQVIYLTFILIISIFTFVSSDCLSLNAVSLYVLNYVFIVTEHLLVKKKHHSFNRLVLFQSLLIFLTCQYYVSLTNTH